MWLINFEGNILRRFGSINLHISTVSMKEKKNIPFKNPFPRIHNRFNYSRRRYIGVVHVVYVMFMVIRQLYDFSSESKLVSKTAECLNGGC